MKPKEKSFVPSVLVAFAVAALIAAAARVGESQARTAGTAAAAARPIPGSAVPATGDAAEDSSQIIGQIEPLLVGSPAPHRDPPRRSARR